MREKYQSIEFQAAFDDSRTVNFAGETAGVVTLGSFFH